MNEPLDISSLALDDQFMILLHKKLMDKKGSAKRRAKKYIRINIRKQVLSPSPYSLQARELWRDVNAVAGHLLCQVM